MAKLAGRQWRVSISEVRLGPHRYRVVRPSRPVGHAVLHDGRLGAQFEVDRHAAVDLACAWWLATRSPRSLVYLPLRSSPFDCGAEYGGRKLDLVLLHHSLGFPVSRWKRVRARLEPSKPHKVTLPTDPLPRTVNPGYVRVSRPDFHDHLRWKIAADTLFLIGSRPVYDLNADRIRELAEDCPEHRANDPDTHCCAEVDIGRWRQGGRDRRDPHALLHIECCAKHWLTGSAAGSGGASDHSPRLSDPRATIVVPVPIVERPIPHGHVRQLHPHDDGAVGARRNGSRMGRGVRGRSLRLRRGTAA